MFRGIFDGPGWIIILAVVLLLFGATRLPALARSIGQSTKIFRDEMKTDKNADAADATAAPSVAAEPVAPPAPAADPAAPKKSAKSPKSAPGASGKTAKP